MKLPWSLCPFVTLVAPFFEEQSIYLTDLDVNKFQSLLLDTTVHIAADCYLKRNESSLILPLEVLLPKPFNE